ncbi:MAG: 16S rRNA (cytidine(1402)-2'-O)-methyltransferase [Dehalococcoidales bacterium]|nr:16S rRNA (cytidine(1402)-2'-O)-methyltransferase [Dehalococcoidales bacterium]
MPALYVVATPIGNLEDITLRALRILKEVKLIAAEDTRKTRRLLTAYSVQTPVTSYFEHNKLTKLDYIIERLRNENVALVSDAGMPGVSDPGYELISAAAGLNIPVVVIPGPSAVLTALAVSGLPTDSFLYLGFLPHKAGLRRRLLKARAGEKSTLVLFEAPHRLGETLKDMLEILGDRRIVVCRELTKLYEEVFRGTLSQAAEHFTAPRGEFTLVVAGEKEAGPGTADEKTGEELSRMKKSGIKAREAVRKLSDETGLSRKELYRAWIKNEKGD